MSWMVDKVEVACPKCGESFADWVRPSYEPAISSSCPFCGHRLEHDASVREDGSLRAAVEEPEEPDR